MLSSSSSLLSVVVLVIITFLSVFHHDALALRCYDGSAFHLSDAFVTDAQLRPSKGLRFTNWNYILIKENCTSCNLVLYTQEPKHSDNTPTVLFHLICDKQEVSFHDTSKLCTLNEEKFREDIKAMNGVDLSNLELSDKVPDWEDRNELKSRVSSRLLADLNATPIRILSNSKRSCRTCTTDLCNYFDMNVNVSCSIRFGVQKFYHKNRGEPLCPPQYGCLIHTNITWRHERSDRAVCLPKGCSRPSLQHCEKFCGDAGSVKKCSCWCNGDYSVKSYNFPTAAPALDQLDPAAASATDSATTSKRFLNYLLLTTTTILLFIHFT